MKEKLAIFLAWRLPRVIVYWCAIRLMAHSTQGKYSNQVVPDLTAMDALGRWRDTDPVMWNPYNKVVQDHRDGTIHTEATNAERKLRGLPVPWTTALADVEVRERPVF